MGAFCGRRVGVALSCLISCEGVSRWSGFQVYNTIDLLECLVIDKTCSVLRDIQLPLLQMLAKLPELWARCQAPWQVRLAGNA